MNLESEINDMPTRLIRQMAKEHGIKNCEGESIAKLRQLLIDIKNEEAENKTITWT